MNGLLTILEDDQFYFDALSADKAVRFIEKYCCHYEGRYAGDPFILHPVQKRIVRDIFGWKSRNTNLRRFTDVYFEAAVGAGKSPLLAAIGLFCLMADGERSAQNYSLASTYSQARIVFDTAKKFAQSNIELERRLVVVEREIRHPASGSFWRIVSGKGPGAGCKPSTILADEVHEWSGPSGYDALRDRMTKRQQPLLIAATNAGELRASFCWQLREKAVAAMDGRGELSLYPIIFTAADDAKTNDPAAWAAANPLIGTTIAVEKIAAKATESMKSPDEEARFRRLYMGIWPKTGGGRWLDLNKWDAVTENFNASDHREDPLYFGLDLSQSDDLSAAAYSWVTRETWYIGCHFWIPKETAKRYHEKDGIPYLDWARDGFIELVDSPTIDAAARKRIATHVVDFNKTHQVKAVCYDRYRADETIAILEAAGIVCIPVPQGYTLSPGCMEFDRRIKEKSIVIVPNPVLRFCAENTETKSDDRGNIWPAKPKAKGKYAGERAKKIDGITAIVTSLVEARKQNFPAAVKEWKGQVVAI